MINKLKKWWEIIIILVLGLTPLLWYKFPNSLALGHDMGFPIDPIMFFKDRLFLWTDRIGLGYDQTINSAAITIHGFEALLFKITSNIFLTQKIVFIFWFILPGLAMYYFVSTIHKSKDQWFIRLSASLFYMFNHFLLQAWFIAERTKISLFVALPLLTGLIIEIVEKRMPAVKGLVLISLVFLFFNGGGGLPLYGGLLLSTILGFLFFAALRLRKDKKESKRLILLAFGIITSFILVNFYWILPTFLKTVFSYKQALTSVGGISGILAWSFEISKYASILNVIRLQGIPDWYDNPQHPYSQIFLNNPILILVSFLIPVVVFSSLFIIKKQPQYRKYIIFFNLLAIFGIIFTTGSHPPFGVIYNLFLSLIPGFAIFRSPFYKFAPALWFSYAYLFSFSLYYLTERLGRLKTVIRFSVLPLILIYSLPFFTGIFFNWNNPFSTMTKLPSYVFSFDRWANSNFSDNDRILTFPAQNLTGNTAIYKWGYWSTAPLESFLTNKSVITNDRVMTEFEKKLVENVYSSLLLGTDDWKKSAKILGINYFLLHNDFYYNAPKYGTDNPELYKNRFQELGLNKKQTFGEWDLYQLPQDKTLVSVESSPSIIIGPPDVPDNDLVSVNSVIGLPNIDNGFYYTDNQGFLNNSVFSNKIIMEECLFCNKYSKKLELSLPKTTFLPGSIFYPLVKFREERDSKILSQNINSQVDFLLGTSLKRVSEIQQLINLNRDERTIDSTISETNSIMDSLTKSLKNLDKNNNDSRLLILKTDNFLKEENRIIDYIEQSTPSNIYLNLLDLGVNISKIYQSNKNFEYPYPQDNEKIYFFNLNSPGNWNLLFKNSEKERLNISGLTIDGQNINLKEQNLGGYSSFGLENLSKGQHEIKFVLSDTQNLIDKISSPSGFIISPAQPSCHDFNIVSVYPNRIYNLKFDYATERSISIDNGPLLKIQQIGRGETYNSRTQLNANSVFQTYEGKIPTSSQTHALKISICPSLGFEDSSTININNLSLRIFAIPAAALVSTNNIQIKNPTITAKQISQTEYKVSVKNAESSYLLTLNNAFDSNWDLRFGGKSTGQHIMVNGFANGWVLDNKGDYELDINYKPQRFYYIGAIVTSVFIIFCLSYFIYKRYEN